MRGDLVEINTINVAALGFTFAGVETALTILVLITALIYNVKRLTDKKDD
jgi:hypothetical protein